MSTAKGPLISQIAITGLIAGTLDIVAACTQAYIKRGTTPDKVFEYIASAFLGKDAFGGGLGVQIMGLIMHYMIATGWTTLFFLLYPRLGFMRGNKYVIGVLYGVFVQIMMTRVLVPMTQVNQGPFNWGGAIQAALILVVCIGIPISLRANKYFAQPAN